MMEMAVRNLAGLIQSEIMGCNSFMEGIEWNPDELSIPSGVVRVVAANAKRRSELRKPPKGGGRGD